MSYPFKRRVWRWIAGGLLGALTLLLGYAGHQVYTYAGMTTDADADVAIVLGAAVWDGAPSPVFAERIHHAIRLYEAERVDRIVFTGGQGLGDAQSEAEVAKAYALQQGVAEEHIHCERQSHVTYGNLQGAKRVMAREGLRDALLVSDPLHMRRAMRMAEDLGLKVAPSPTPTTRYRTWRSQLRFLLREARLYASYLLRRPWMRHE